MAYLSVYLFPLNQFPDYSISIYETTLNPTHLLGKIHPTPDEKFAIKLQTLPTTNFRFSLLSTLVLSLQIFLYAYVPFTIPSTFHNSSPQ